MDLSLEMTSPSERSAMSKSENTKGILREYQANLTLCLGILINGISFGFSAVAIPNIILENNSTQVVDREHHEIVSPLIPIVSASRDQLSWFGEYFLGKLQNYNIFFCIFIFSAGSLNIGRIIGSLLGGYLCQDPVF